MEDMVIMVAGNPIWHITREIFIPPASLTIPGVGGHTAISIFTRTHNIKEIIHFLEY